MNTRSNTNLNFLRASAVLLVLVGHLTGFFDLGHLGSLPLIGLGRLGVLIFFVHTALVLMLSLERQAAASKILFIPFMIRRCFRIYPLSMAVVLGLAALHVPQATIGPGHFGGWNFDGGDLLSNVFLVQNLSFRVPILGPTWSLPYELEMYLFLPLIFLFLRNTRSLWRLGAGMALLVAGSAVVAQHSSVPNLAFYVPCFLAGVFSYQLRNAGFFKLPAYLWPLFITGVVILYLLSDLSRVKGWLVCFLLGMAIPVFAPITSRGLNAASELIAKYSYGIYLTHFFVIWLAFEKLYASPLLFKIGIFLSLATALPVVFYHLIEEPMIEFGRKIAGRYIDERQRKTSPRDVDVAEERIPTTAAELIKA